MQLLYERLKNEYADIIIPVPISKKRMNERGYNQAELIAKKLSTLLNIKYNKNTLIKIRDTKRQSELPKEERNKNIKNSFKLADTYSISSKNVILIDDVFTTGVTANECSKELKKGGAHKITVATIARARH
jgi:ComF family protein